MSPTEGDVSRLLLAVSLTTLAACGDCTGAQTQPTTAGVRVDPEARLGRVWVSDTAHAVFVITAAGTGWIAVRTIDTDEPAIRLEWEGGLPLRLQPGATLPVRVSWSPASPALLDATIRVETDVEAAPRHVVRVTGEAVALPGCDDGDPCTDDSFDRVSGTCTHAAHGRTCDDGSACTADDRCFDGACRGVPRACGDDDVCTLDLCDPAGGCLHPPDDRRCDDSDPCTADVCDPREGCAHPPAPDGTACGPLSCAEAHICARGTCRALDISGISDGYPCSDGDACTEPDMCSGGTCRPGEAVRRQPQVKAVLPTYGGPGASVASDGFRYLFAGPDGLHIVVRSASQGLSLQHVHRLATQGTPVSPVNLGPGRFAFADANMVLLVDATNAAGPSLQFNVSPNLGPNGSLVRSLAAAPDGLLVVAAATGCSWLSFLPLSNPFQLAVPRALLCMSGLDDVVVDGSDVFFIADAGSGPGVFRLSLGPGAGSIAPERVDVPIADDPPRRVAAHGQNLAVAYASRILVSMRGAARSAGPVPTQCMGVPGCPTVYPTCAGPSFEPGAYVACGDGASCPQGSSCVPVNAGWTGTRSSPPPEEGCSRACCPGVARVPLCWYDTPLAPLLAVVASANDVLLDDELLWWSDSGGVHAVPVAGGSGTPPAWFNADPMSAERLAAGPGEILASGRIALPLAKTGTGVTARLSGPGHGGATAVVDGAPGRAWVAGPATLGEIDLNSGRFESWRLLTTASTTATLRLLRGATRDSVVDVDVDDRCRRLPPGSACPGTHVAMLDRQGSTTDWRPDGLFTGNVDAGGGRLWAWTTREITSPDAACCPEYAARTWTVGGAPEADLPLTPPPSMAGSIRVADDGTEAAVVMGELWPRNAIPPLYVNILARQGDRWTASATLTVPEYSDMVLPAARDVVGLDGRLVLIGGWGRIDLWHADSAQRPLASLPLTGAFAGYDVRVPWMASGRAWVSWFSSFSGRPGGWRMLSDIRYGAGGTLEEAGRVEVPDSPVRMLDLGSIAVATAAGSITILAPACR